MPVKINLRKTLIKTVQSFSTHGLGVGSAGNLSVRTEDGFIITPTGVPYAELTPDLLVELNIAGDVVDGHLLPSSEWHFHRAIYADRTDVNAVLHAHPPFATAIACTRRTIPAFHYMVAVAGGDTIRCADYATFGTTELSDNALSALQDRQACLLANHGIITLGSDIPSAFKLALEVEELAKQYYYSLQIGDPHILDKMEMDRIQAKFRTYGKQNKKPA